MCDRMLTLIFPRIQKMGIVTVSKKALCVWINVQ